MSHQIEVSFPHIQLEEKHEIIIQPPTKEEKEQEKIKELKKCREQWRKRFVVCKWIGEYIPRKEIWAYVIEILLSCIGFIILLPLTIVYESKIGLVSLILIFTVQLIRIIADGFSLKASLPIAGSVEPEETKERKLNYKNAGKLKAVFLVLSGKVSAIQFPILQNSKEEYQKICEKTDEEYMERPACKFSEAQNLNWRL